MDTNTVQQFKKTIEDIVDAKLENKGITKYVSAIVSAVNNDNTVDVYLPPDVSNKISHLLNKTGEILYVGDSVELCTKNGKTSNAWVSVRHGVSAPEPKIDWAAMIKQDIDLSGYATNTFYPVTWKSSEFVHLEVFSPSFGGGEPYNTNRLRATISSRGWSDVPYRLNIEEATQFQSDEITIYGLFRGTRQGNNAVYLRGGLKYSLRCNVNVTLYARAVTLDEESFPLISGTDESQFVNVNRMWRYDGFKDIINNTHLPLYSYPVGAIYLSVSSTSPASLFGGTWERLKDRFLLAAGDTYSAGATGGSKNHNHTTGDCTLTANQIPSHSHKVTSRTTSYASGSQTSWRCLSWDGTNADYYQDVWSESTGGGQAHNHGSTGYSDNMPPYLVVYVWKRTA